MRKLISLILTAVFLLSLPLTVFATEGATVSVSDCTLTEGATTEILITVTPQVGKEKIYILRVFREAPPIGTEAPTEEGTASSEATTSTDTSVIGIGCNAVTAATVPALLILFLPVLLKRRKTD